MSNILEYKSKEELTREKAYESVAGLPVGILRDRLLRISLGEEIEGDRLFASNMLVSVKLQLRKIYYNTPKYRDEIKKHENWMSITDNEDDKQKCITYIDSISKLLELYKEQLRKYGSIINLLTGYIDKYFSNEEIIQLLGGGYEEAKRIKEWHDNRDTGSRSLTTSYIMHHVEYRWNKQRCKDFVDCPEWEMPLFNCLSEYIFECINNDPKARQDMDEHIEDIFSECRVITTVDSEGNIVGAEKIIQEINASELIRRFKGKYISKLKNDTLLELDKLYKIKNNRDGSYSILDKDKESIAIVYENNKLKASR